MAGFAAARYALPMASRSMPPSAVPAGASRLVHFAGRAGDRNASAMRGAATLATLLADRHGTGIVRVGEPAPPLAAGWRVELEAASAGLAALRRTLGEALAAGPAVTVLNRCAAALGTLPAVATARPVAVIVWLDAHGDCNLPGLTTSGYLGGLVLRAAAGLWDSGLGAGIDLADVVLVGARDLDPFERALVEEGRLRLLPPGPGLAARLETAVAGRPVYVHLDCDVLAPGVVPTEYQVPGGLGLAELGEVAAMLAELPLAGLEIAEFEAEWPDGTPGDARPLVDALAPLLARWRA